MNLNPDRCFWTTLDKLIDMCEVKIDRPKGNSHPHWPNLVYPLDYGYLVGSKSGDGNEIDIWRGSLPESRLTAIAVTVDTYKLDSEIKLLLGCTEEELTVISAFHNSGCQNAIIIKRNAF